MVYVNGSLNKSKTVHDFYKYSEVYASDMKENRGGGLLVRA